MVASTDIKFYAHTNNNTPQIQNAYGSLIGVLDACLVNGIQVGIVSSLTAIGTVVTATFSAAHNLFQYQVIMITGANQDEFNGEHRILTVPNSNSITFQLASTPSVATASGTINCSLPPLGFSKPFSGSGKAAYRSTNTLLSSRPYLRVVDVIDPVWNPSYAKFAKVGIVEAMNDIDDLSGFQVPFDISASNKNWEGTGSGSAASNGWAKWYYALSSAAHISQNETQSPGNGIRPWLIFGDGDVFYLLNNVSISDGNYIMHGFGAIDSLLQGAGNDTFLISCLNNSMASTDQTVAEKIGGVNAFKTICLHKGLTGSSSIDAFTMGLVWDMNYASGWFNTIGTSASINQTTSQPILYENFVPIGKMPLLHWLYTKIPLNSGVSGRNVDFSFYPVGVSTGIVRAGQILMRIM